MCQSLTTTVNKEHSGVRNLGLQSLQFTCSKSASQPVLITKPCEHLEPLWQTMHTLKIQLSSDMVLTLLSLLSITVQARPVEWSRYHSSWPNHTLQIITIMIKSPDWHKRISLLKGIGTIDQILQIH